MRIASCAFVVALASALPLVVPATTATASADERPNFVIVMTDDQRADALSCAGNTILQTPHLDRLAAEGMRFTNMFVTNSLCAPSRATLLTGLYSHAHGVIDNKNRALPADRPLLSDLLREAGYEVAFCGKSHVAGALRDRKWDYYFGYQGQGEYLKPVIAEGTDGPDRPYEGYMDDVVTDHALAWLRQPHERPFCLLLWFKSPHRSWLRARRHHDLFRDAAIPIPDTYDDDLTGYPGKPRAFAEADNKIGTDNDVRSLDFVKDYYATLSAVDENVGRVLDTLEQTGALDRTAVLFTSDNGFFHGEWRLFDKRLMHEPSIRVPLLVRYPPLVEAGGTCDAMVLNVDLAPTVLDLAGLDVPETMHGRSAVPLLRGESPPWRNDWLYEYYEYPGPHSVRKHRGIRTERYKLIHYYEEPQEYELYDLGADPGERRNLYGEPAQAALVERLLQRIEALRRETGDPDLPH
jgi:arylsulfatase A-like enzyme